VFATWPGAGLNQEVKKAKLQQLPFGISPDSKKAKALARSIAIKSSPCKDQGGLGCVCLMSLRGGCATFTILCSGVQAHMSTWVCRHAIVRWVACVCWQASR